MKRLVTQMLALMACLAITGCVAENTNQANKNAVPSPVASATPSPSPADETAAKTDLLTLPVLDAFFADESFSGLLKTRLQLTDEQVAKLKDLAHSETAKLNEESAGASAGESSTARSEATEKIGLLIGPEKTRQLATLIGERWTGDEGSDKTAAQPKKAPN